MSLIFFKTLLHNHENTTLIGVFILELLQLGQKDNKPTYVSLGTNLRHQFKINTVT